MNDYLIPANTKKGQLIFGMFKPFDLMLLSIGVLISIAILAFVPISNTVLVLIALAPGVVCGALVVPIPNYHNLLTIIIELYEFIVNRQKFRWRGWCVDYGKTVKYKKKRN